MSSDEIIYRKQRKFCGKSRCKKCRDGIGHGPYWFATQMVNGKKTQVYIGKHLPPGIQAAQPLSIQTTDTIPGSFSSSLSAHHKKELTTIGRTHQNPLIGRDTERQSVHSLLLHAEQYTQHPPVKQRTQVDGSPTSQSQAQCVLLLGEAGIGKTRLAEEVGRFTQQRGWTVLWGRSYAQESTIPYQLWTEVLRKAMTFNMTVIRRTLTSSPHSFEPLMALLPELKDALPHATLLPLPMEQQPHHLWEAVHRLLTVLSARAPLLVVLDDLQWADVSSCSLLAYLARRLSGHAIIVIGTCREEELGDNHPLRSLLADPQQERMIRALPMLPLSDEQIGVLISSIPNLPEMVVQQIQRSAVGNPFFAEELAQISQLTKLDTAAFHREESTFSPLPATISATFDLRLGRLSGACQRLLSRAAILGDSFEYPILRAMEASGSTDEDTVLDLLEEALQARILIEEGVGAQVTYRFWHPLFVSHLYEGISAVRRMHLHRQAAALIREVYQGREDEGAATIMYHLVRGAADAQQIVHYAELAGDRAYRLSAYVEAERYYRVAVEQVDADRVRVQEPRINSFSGQPDHPLYLASLLERLAECRMILGNYEETRRLYEWLLQLHNSAQFPTIPPDRVKQEAQFQAMVWCEIGWTWWYEGEPAKARQCRERGEQVLRSAGIDAGPAWANLLYQLGSTGWQEGDYTAARLSAQKALKLFEEVLSRQHPRESLPPSTRIRRTLAGDPVDLGRIHKLLAAVAALVGQTADATFHLNAAMPIFEQHDREREIAMVCGNLGDIHLRKAEYILAQVAFQRSLDTAERIGDTPTMSGGMGNLGLVATRLGDLAKAEDLLRRGLTLAMGIGDPVYSIYCQSYLALVLQEQGKILEAGNCIRSALNMSRSKHIPPCIGLALVTLGQMRIAYVGTDTVGHPSTTGQSTPDHKDIQMHSLWRAEASICHALTIEGLEAEAKIEGQLALAQIFLMRSELEKAQQQAKHALEEAQRSELAWLLACSQRLLGCILAGQDNDEQANAYFQQALQFFRERGMRLEYARALQSYGRALLRRKPIDQQGLLSLREAHQIFDECHAVLALQAVKDLLSTYTS